MAIAPFQADVLAAHWGPWMHVSPSKHTRQMAGKRCISKCMQHMQGSAPTWCFAQCSLASCARPKHMPRESEGSKKAPEVSSSIASLPISWKLPSFFVQYRILKRPLQPLDESACGALPLKAWRKIFLLAIVSQLSARPPRSSSVT